MEAEANLIWTSLELRKPELLRLVEPLSARQMDWLPSNGRNSVGWLLWHIAEVEDNWIRSVVTGEPLRFPFDVQVRAATDEQFPPRSRLLEYFQEVRGITRGRLESATAQDFQRSVEDPDFGTLTVLDVWSGVVTSFAWHAGQIAQTAKLMPDTPVTTMTFDYWQAKKWQRTSERTSASTRPNRSV